MISNSLFTFAALLCSLTAAQTYSSCNPLTATCPADTALGTSINVDFTKGSVNSFTASGSPTYGPGGVSFTVAKSGDAPQLTSIFYIMFGKVSITMKAAPGAGVVSTLVLQSDDLDEIDMEWLGADGTEVQTNYFGKGDVTTYNRGEFNPAANNQNEFITYTVEWTAEQVTWSVGSTVVRVLTPATADANQYPQTPMQVKFGAWSGGDRSNAPGTITWARGPTDYSLGPFTMLVQSLAVTDYSTGKQYKYGDTSGTWESIEAVGGAVNGNANGAAGTVASADVPAATSASPSIPAGMGGSSQDNTLTQTGWPWVASATTMQTAVNTYSSSSIPSGWIISSSGKIVPANSAATLPVSTPTSSLAPSPSPSSPHSQGTGLETITGWDDKGFPTTKTEPSGWETMSKSYNQQGFLITSTAETAGGTADPSSTLSADPSSTLSKFSTLSVDAPGFGQSPAGKVVATSMSQAAAPRETNVPWKGAALAGLIVAAAERLLL